MDTGIYVYEMTNWTKIIRGWVTVPLSICKIKKKKSYKESARTSFYLISVFLLNGQYYLLNFTEQIIVILFTEQKI